MNSTYLTACRHFFDPLVENPELLSATKVSRIAEGHLHISAPNLELSIRENFLLIEPRGIKIIYSDVLSFKGCSLLEVMEMQKLSLETIKSMEIATKGGAYSLELPIDILLPLVSFLQRVCSADN